MVKVVEASRNADGLPRVSWEQDVPTGELQYGFEQRMALKFAAVVGVFIFAWAYSAGWEFWGAAFAAVIVASLLLGGGQVAFKGGFNVAGVHIPGQSGPSEATLAKERELQAIAMMEKEHCRVEVAPPRMDPKQLYLFVERGPSRDKLQRVATVPLATIQPFELGTAEEWFGDISQGQRHREQALPNSYVIVNPTLGHGVIGIAESGGSKAGITALHGLLTREIVARLGEMQQRWKERVEEDEEAERRRRSSG